MIIATLSDIIQLEGFEVKVSTSNMDYLAHPHLKPETCLFWQDESVVVDEYLAWPQAVEGHVAWVDAERVAQAILEYRRDVS